MAHYPSLTAHVDKSVVMAKAYYGRRLLELGPLAYGEFREITGWQPEVTEAVLQHLRRTRAAEWVNGRWRLRS
jgi:hypothetical protein